MTSIRNAPVDIALARIQQYLRTHNYDDCAVYINRLHSNTFRKILLTDLSFDNLLGQLPFSIEIFEIVYSKMFIIEPDTFPLRILKPDRLLSKMISVFSSKLEKSSSSSSIQSKSHEQSIDDERLLSNLASILRVISYIQPILFKRLLHQKETIDECILYFEQRPHSTVPNTPTLKKSASVTHINLEETIRHELESTITCCQQALHKLGTKTLTPTMPLASPAIHSTPNVRKKRNSMPISPSTITISPPTINSLDDIQKRLYQHKAILNLIEPYLSRTKLYTTINNLTYKVSIDKQILLAYAHIKSHEKQLPINKPLLPLFKRFAFAYERIIQLWRRVTDSTLIDECTDDIVIDDTTVKSIGGICFQRTRSQNELAIPKDDMAVRNGQLIMSTAISCMYVDQTKPPLQPLGLNVRNRIFVSPSSLIQPPQSKVVLPSATSLQSLAPTNPILPSSDPDDKERLKTDLIQLKTELQKSKETIARLQKSEEQMRERLAEQAQRQLEKSGKFEDLNQISRPTELIRSYNSLYSQARIDALDALESMREISQSEDLKSKLLFSVVVLAFRHAQNHAREVRNKIKQILQLSNDKSSIVLEETIEKYLRTTIQKYDVAKIILEVENQLWTTLYDYPSLKSCKELLKYITQACRTAWGLVNQTPPYYIEFQTMKYDKQIHERFHTSDNASETISEYMWPCLIDGRDRTCVAKGVVLTDEPYLSIPKNFSS